MDWKVVSICGTMQRGDDYIKPEELLSKLIRR